MYDTGQPQVTNWDEVANTLAEWREQLPAITTFLSYAEATQLVQALEREMERFEKSRAYERIARAAL